MKNRVHLDLRPYPGDDQAAEAARLRALGATDIDLGQGDVPWTCLAEPEGNEFDVLTPLCRGALPTLTMDTSDGYRPRSAPSGACR